jgi:hypothetical protein
MQSHDRRIHKRKAPEHLAYLSLPSDNGGIVTDLSTGGLGFRAIAPVDTTGPIHFRFAINSSTRIGAVGELAWIDKTGKSGGLRFTHLPDEVREQIRIWTGQSKTNAEAHEKAEAEAGVDDVQIAEPAIVDTVASYGRAEVVLEANAQVNWSARDSDVLVAEPETAVRIGTRGSADLVREAHVPANAPANAFASAPAIAEVEAPFEDIQIVEPEILARIAPSGSGFLRNAERPNMLLYSLKSPIYSAPFYSLSMFPLPEDTVVWSTDYCVPSSFVVPSSFPDASSLVRSHPIAAIGLTIGLALLVTIGIFVFLSAILAGDSLFDWGEKAPGASYSQLAPKSFAPSSNPAFLSSLITHQ